jgi:hypothetical protein
MQNQLSERLRSTLSLGFSSTEPNEISRCRTTHERRNYDVSSPVSARHTESLDPVLLIQC